ncbi:putative sulfate exporter family transporter [Proteinivorax tanatarense]|uniref:Sulfate exporter family transporter n=1 Tax=Proteinivorax tanatarense TaxID=1260629 RepID=A0AAU7VJZ6_9FIRM
MIIKICPGLALAAALAAFSVYVTELLPYHLIGASVLSLIIGMFINPFISKHDCFNTGINFTSKKVLKFSIILMGLSLSFSQVVEVGRISLVVMIFTLLTAFLGGYLVGKLLKLDWKLAGLLSAGTGICGGSAIAAVGPVIEADDSAMAYAISATFVFDILMVILFPIMGNYFNMTDLGFGLWTGTAINDTSSVVAAGYSFSDVAGNYSVIVKLTRTLAIVPVVLVFSVIHAKIAKKESNDNSKVSIIKIFPWFILLFIAMVAIKSTGIIPDPITVSISNFSRFLMVMALGAIGLKTSFNKLIQAGFAPLLHGFTISMAVVVVSFVIQVFLGQV